MACAYKPAAPSITTIVVTFESAAVLEHCLRSLEAAAPSHGTEVLVVDNASSDGSHEIAARTIGDARVVPRRSNGGFAAGVNEGVARAATQWIAVVNPDTIVPARALDALVGILEAHPRGALVGPQVRDDAGRIEPTVGRFPTLAREWAHSLGLDHLGGFEGRRAPFPPRTAPVHWVSGCFWMLRAEAAAAVGQLDEQYFMYYEDVDYCRRLWDAGWEVLATPEVGVTHRPGHGSTATPRIPADGGRSLLRYFAKFHPEVAPAHVRRVLVGGWRLRRVWRRVRAATGDATSLTAAERYRLAIEAVESR